MKLKINVDGSEREVTISGLKGKHKKGFLKKIREVSEKAKEKDISVIGEMEAFLDYQDDMALEVCDLKKEEYEDLDLEEQNKILFAIRKIIFPQSEGESFF